jgi:hypothetical protein
MSAFFWLALFPMILGGILLTIFIFILKREGKKPTNTESKKITPAKFIDEVAQFSNIENAEAEKIIEFVFSYFPEFNWRKKLPRVRNEKIDEGNEEKAKKSEEKAENETTHPTSNP